MPADHCATVYVELADAEPIRALLSKVADVCTHAAHFIEQADRRAEGTGDFDAYHSARHVLVMALDDALTYGPEST